MKQLTFAAMAILLSGCSNSYNAPGSTDGSRMADTNKHTQCPGTTALPPALADKFIPIEDPELLAQSLGETDQGKLCQGQVYRVKEDTEIPLYRAWNSTNPNSKMGNWWAFSVPAGSSSQYRQQYEICYQWSPLDRMSSCTLKANTKVVVGTGQSATCSEYLTYPTSVEQQIYIDQADTALEECNTFTGHFDWQPIPQ
ncbi:hypothetical protein LZP73_14165 [Shewanella sp. AS16]|uniref:hypothetical protein n=1 Tax=Shewanella sp. AS16 TaxID=2907625 RepID=UPI001F1AD61E|nr:hypothetical protein [Shewanella sp. AS16]MCE9687336.1 hypothetical protein [Shewanella sp. AS16]